MPMYTGTILFDLLLPPHTSSLKEKRSAVRPIVAELRRRYEVSAAEVGAQDLHRRTEIGIALVSGNAGHLREVMDACERLVAGRPEVELLSARRQWWSSDDEGED